MHSANPIKESIIRYIFYAFLTGAAVLCITWEAHHNPSPHLFGEHSIPENLQATLLILTAVVATLTGRVRPSAKGISTILTGAATIALIREFDYALDDNVFDGAWQILALAVALITMVNTAQSKDNLAESIHGFMTRPSFGIMAGGFMTVFVYSRFLGRQLLWQAIMGDGYMRVVKTAVEESTELLGYTLIFIGTLEFLHEGNRAVIKTDLPEPCIYDHTSSPNNS